MRIMVGEDYMIIGFLATASTVKYVVLLRNYRCRPDDAVQIGTVGQLFIHPVKSCAGISVQEAYCAHTGLQHVSSGCSDR